MTEQEENYIHFVSCIENFNKAWVILQKIKSSKENSIFKGWSFELALIEYSKPYTWSFGEIRKRKLEEIYIPTQYSDLHEKILNARNQIHAHSDLTIKEAKLYVKNFKSKKYVSIVQNKIDPLIEFQNIDLILDLIEQTLDKMYLERETLDKKLPDDE